MSRSEALTPVQVEVARIFFGLKASHGFLVAGGAALLASELITRPTEDLDLFASNPTASVTEAKEALVEALEHRDHVRSISSACVRHRSTRLSNERRSSSVMPSS